jgi:hypothetical protein
MPKPSRCSSPRKRPRVRRLDGFFTALDAVNLDTYL